MSAPPVQDHITRVAGVRVAGVHAGLRRDGAPDFALFASERDCTVAAVFTTNVVKAACVLHDIDVLAADSTRIRAVAVNTKCANACTGDQGLVNARGMAQAAADALGCDVAQVLVLSTGVIGTQLDMPKIRHGAQLAASQLAPDAWPNAARAIMTTDTRPKQASATVTLPSGGVVTIAGVSKGSGMIAPNMATMLGVLVTDAQVAQPALQTLLNSANARTFNRIVVDGDTSTNDTVLLLANGASEVVVASDEDLRAFEAALTGVCQTLAQAIVRDGEGATRFITIHVRGAASDADARAIGHTVAASPLVKTAFFGADANWGRILAAAGRAGVRFHSDDVDLEMAAGTALDAPGLRLVHEGVPTGYDETAATAIVSAPEVVVRLRVGDGPGQAVVWTCDLSYEYVRINGDYRT